MRHAFLFIVIFAVCSVAAISQSPPESATRILSYRFDRDGVLFTVLATNFNGVCNVTVKRRTTSGLSEKTASMDSTVFTRLMDGVSRIPAIASAHFTAGSPAVDTETHHIITTFIKSAAGSKGDTYAVPDKDAPEAFRAWLKLLFDAIPKA
jgi:hypothetical protein